MTVLGYWTSQEQYRMQELLEFVAEAEKGGFTSTLTSDHFHPWWHDNGFGNFTCIVSAPPITEALISNDYGMVNSNIPSTTALFRVDIGNSKSSYLL